MTLWTGDNEISDTELFEAFPEQCFPEIEGLDLRIGEKALHIIGTDSEWALQSDIALAVGPGHMSFFYTGELRFQVDGPEGTQAISMSEVQAKGLPTPQEILLIKRGQMWEFVFSCPEQKKMIVFAEVTGMSWTPGEEE